MKHPLSILGILFAAVLLPASARAEHFHVQVTLYCPSIATGNPAGLDLSSFDSTPMHTPVFTQTPCAGLRVVAMDSDPGWDEYCGAGYTNSHGQASFDGDCSDGFLAGGGPPEVYLRVEARSMLGFSVGVHSFSFLQGAEDVVKATVSWGTAIPSEIYDYFKSHDTFVWESDEMQPSGDGVTLNFGTWNTGEGDSVSVKAGRTFWMAQYAMGRITGGNQRRPMDFDYTVDSVFGTPTTLYDTVLDQDDSGNLHRLEEAPHEIGHVLYNTYHSGETHFFTDATDYMTTHQACAGSRIQTLAWYEGFADFVRDFVYQSYEWPYPGHWKGHPPTPGCPSGDVSDEGNVEGFLNTIFYGPTTNIPPVTVSTCPSGYAVRTYSDRHEDCVKDVAPTCETGRTIRVDRTGYQDECFLPGGIPDAIYQQNCVIHHSCNGGDDQPLYRSPVCPARAGLIIQVDLVVQAHADVCALHQTHGSSVDSSSPLPRADGSADLAPGHNAAASKLVWFTMPGLDNVVDWVAQDGGNSHRAREFWSTRIHGWCSAQSSGAYYAYCNPAQSPDFLSRMTALGVQ